MLEIVTKYEVISDKSKNYLKTCIQILKKKKNSSTCDIKRWIKIKNLWILPNKILKKSVKSEWTFRSCWSLRVEKWLHKKVSFVLDEIKENFIAFKLHIVHNKYRIIYKKVVSTMIKLFRVLWSRKMKCEKMLISYFSFDITDLIVVILSTYIYWR